MTLEIWVPTGSLRGETRLPSMPKAATVIRRFALALINRELFLGNLLREIRFTGCLRKVRELLQVSPETLRDRRLLPLNLDMVDAVRIRTPAKEFSLRREGDGMDCQRWREQTAREQCRCPGACGCCLYGRSFGVPGSL